ncbi:beta-glucosidase 1 [Arachis duranensis]|uniref:Beta-glucosidase 1 n=1 Tax=Arachis duranensis TaxID=130453 RepID=A0A9C6WJ21_ARADU|nr:beta-glucosidase 1 [Arachis duranensis]
MGDPKSRTQKRCCGGGEVGGGEVGGPVLIVAFSKPSSKSHRRTEQIPYRRCTTRTKTQLNTAPRLACHHPKATGQHSRQHRRATINQDLRPRHLRPRRLHQQRFWVLDLGSPTIKTAPPNLPPSHRLKCIWSPSHLFRVMKPLLHGDYPTSMKKIAGERIPTFTDRESKLVKGSYGFIGLIHYTNINITYNSLVLESNLRDFSADMAVLMRK